MKKLLILIAVSMMIFTLAGCKTEKEEEVETVEEDIVEEVHEPVIKEYDSLKTININLGVNIEKAFEKAEDTGFYTIDDSIGVYEFDYRSHSWMIRASRDLMIDLSGIYEEGEYIPEAGTPIFYYGEEEYVSRFAYNKVQYTLTVNNDDLKPSDFEAVVVNYLDILSEDMDEDLKELCGLYFEEGDKGSMRVYPVTDQTVSLAISMPVEDSEEYNVWSMEEAYISGSMLKYDTCEHFIENPEDGTSIGVNDAVHGYFTIEDETLKWNGSGVVETSRYVFHK